MERDENTSNFGGGFIVVVVIGLGLWWASSLFSNGGWTGFFYPNYNYSNPIQSNGTFASLDDCREWVNGQIASTNSLSYDYECGLGCRYESQFNNYVCEETRQ